ncbi:MAG: SDR family oxidoreductase [Eubacteriales bacterium]|nr:SDR family oxidoreductase [Eubacteriales bacterium]
MRKTTVITGSSRGLGFELAKQFRRRHYNLVLCATNEEKLDKAINELKEINANGKITGRVCDVSNLSEVEALADHAMETFGRIDIWINNAGVNQSFQYAWEVGEDEIDRLLDVDLKGTINGSNAAMRKMIKQGFGEIYNVEGMGSNDSFQPCFTLYGTAKRAVTYFTDGLANEIKDQKLPIIVGKLSPGIMITDFLTSVGSNQNATELNEKTKKVYNILGDYPDVIAAYLVKEIIKNKKNGKRIEWLTNKKASIRFMTSAWNKRDFFE